MNKKLLATGGIVSSLFLVGTSIAFASTDTTADKSMHHAIPTQWVTTMASKLGLNPEEVKTELSTGKTLKDIFNEHDITPEKVKAAFGDHTKHKRMKMGHEIGTKPHMFTGKMMHMQKDIVQPEMFQMQATILGITTEQLQQELKDKQSFMQVVEAHGLTRADLKAKMAEAIQKLIDGGTLSAEKNAFYQKLLQHQAHHKLEK